MNYYVKNLTGFFFGKNHEHKVNITVNNRTIDCTQMANCNDKSYYKIWLKISRIIELSNMNWRIVNLKKSEE